MSIMRNGAELITAERYKQLTEKGYTHEHDRNIEVMDFIRAAEAYINSAEGFAYPQGVQAWPWNRRYFKPLQMRRDLVRAGALIAAALDRLNYEYFADGPRVVYHHEVGKNFVCAYLIEWNNFYPNRTYLSSFFKTEYEAITDLYNKMVREEHKHKDASKMVIDHFHFLLKTVKEECLQQRALNPGVKIPKNNKGWN